MINPDQNNLLKQLMKGEELPADHFNKLAAWASNLSTSAETSENNEEPKKKKRKLNRKTVITAEKDAESNTGMSQPMPTSTNTQNFWNTSNTPSLQDVPADDNKSEKLIKKIKKALSLNGIQYYHASFTDHCIIRLNNAKSLRNLATVIQNHKKFPSVDNNPDFKRFFSLSDSIMVVFHKEAFISSELNEFFKKITFLEFEDNFEFLKTEAMKPQKIFQTLIRYHQSEFEDKNSPFYKFFRYYTFPGGDFFKYIAGKPIDPMRPFEPGAEKIIHFLEQAELCCPGINSDHFIFKFSDPEILKKFNMLLNNYMNTNLAALSFEDRSRFFKLGNHIMIVFRQADQPFNSVTLQGFFTTEIKISDRDENLEAIKNSLPGRFSFQPLKGHSKFNDERNEYFLKLEKYYNPSNGLFFEYYEPLQIVNSLQKRQTLEETSENPMNTQFTSDTNPSETESSKQEISDEEETISQTAQEINPDDIVYLEFPLSPKF